MKNLFSFVALMSLADLSAVAFQEMDYRYVSASGTTSWSTAAWEIYVGPNGSEKVDYETAGISKYPNSNKVGLNLNWNLKQLDVDGEYTVGRIFSNPSVGVTQNSDSMVNLLGTAAGGSDGVINIDTGYIYSQYGYNGSGTDTNSMRWAIYLSIGNEHSQSKWDYNPESKVTFNGGTINIGNSSDSSMTSGIRLAGTGSPAADSTLTEPLKKTVTFTETNTINSSTNLMFQGATAETILGETNSCANVTFNLDGTIYVRENTGSDDSPIYTYKNLTFKSDSTPTPFTAHYNIGGVIEAGSWTIDTNQQINLTSTAYIMLNGGELRMSNWGVSRDLEFNMAAGSVLSAKNIWIGDRTKLNISGSVTTTDGTLYIYQNSQSLDSTRLVVNQGATFDLKDSLNIAQATVEVAAGVAAESLIIGSGSIRLDNNHATLILRSSNTFKKTDNGSQSEMMISMQRGNGYLELYADQDFHHFNFENTTIASHTSGIDYMTLNLYIDSSVDLIKLSSLADGTLGAVDETTYLKKNMVIDGFREYLIHLDNINPDDDLSLVSSKDGDWVDFKYIEDTVNGGYWLSATNVVPEPAMFAALLGTLAVFLAVSKRGRK